MNPEVAFITYVLVGSLTIILMFSGFRIVSTGYVYTVKWFGKYHRTLQPGMRYVIPFIESVINKINIKVQIMTLPTHTCYTNDGICINIDVILFFRIAEPKKASILVDHSVSNFQQLALYSLNQVVNFHSVSSTMKKRNALTTTLLSSLNEEFNSWGVVIEKVNIRNIHYPNKVTKHAAHSFNLDQMREPATHSSKRNPIDSDSTILDLPESFDAHQRIVMDDLSKFEMKNQTNLTSIPRIMHENTNLTSAPEMFLDKTKFEDSNNPLDLNPGQSNTSKSTNKANAFQSTPNFNASKSKPSKSKPNKSKQRPDQTENEFPSNLNFHAGNSDVSANPSLLYDITSEADPSSIDFESSPFATNLEFPEIINEIEKTINDEPADLQAITTSSGYSYYVDPTENGLAESSLTDNKNSADKINNDDSDMNLDTLLADFTLDATQFEDDLSTLNQVSTSTPTSNAKDNLDSKLELEDAGTETNWDHKLDASQENTMTKSNSVAWLDDLTQVREPESDNAVLATASPASDIDESLTFNDYTSEYQSLSTDLTNYTELDAIKIDLSTLSSKLSELTHNATLTSNTDADWSTAVDKSDLKPTPHAATYQAATYNDESKISDYTYIDDLTFTNIDNSHYEDGVDICNIDKKNNDTQTSTI